MRQLTDKQRKSLAPLLDAFENNDFPGLVASAYFPRYDTPGAHRSLRNRVLSLAQTGTLDTRGFRQWEKVGRSVKKGAHAAYIWGPITRKTVDDETGDESRILAGFRLIPVFPLHATEGEPLVQVELQHTPPDILAIADRMGVPVEFASKQSNNPNAGGYYSPRYGNVVLQRDDAHVLLHELAHAADDQLQALRKRSYAASEIVAEAAAACLGHILLNNPPTARTRDYLAGYAKELDLDPHTAVLNLVGDITAVIEYVLSHASESAQAA